MTSTNDTTDKMPGANYDLDSQTGQFGFFPLASGTLDLTPDGDDLPRQKIGKIVVAAGSGPVLVSGIQDNRQSDKVALGLLPPLTALSLGEGTHWLNITNVIVDATAGSCFIYWG